MKAIKKLMEVEKDKSVTIKSLPFKPGSKDVSINKGSNFVRI